DPIQRIEQKGRRERIVFGSGNEDAVMTTELFVQCRRRRRKAFCLDAGIIDGKCVVAEIEVRDGSALLRQRSDGNSSEARAVGTGAQRGGEDKDSRRGHGIFGLSDWSNCCFLVGCSHADVARGALRAAPRCYVTCSVPMRQTLPP